MERSEFLDAAGRLAGRGLVRAGATVAGVGAAPTGEDVTAASAGDGVVAAAGTYVACRSADNWFLSLRDGRRCYAPTGPTLLDRD